MSRRTFTIGFRLFFAVLSLIGVITQLVVTLQNHYSVVNFFSYFTNLSNLFASAVFTVSAIWLALDRRPTQLGVALRGSSVVYIAFVGIVFNTLLTDADLGDLKPWVNVIVHMLMPIAGVVDWLVWPPRLSISVRTALLWTSFPVVYVVYSLIRGGATGFYPYPFLNHHHAHGSAGVAAYCVVLLLAFVALAFAVRYLGQHSRQAPAAP